MSDYPLFPIEVCFCYGEIDRPSAVSKFLATEVTETTEQPIYYHYKKAIYKERTYLALYYVFFFEHNPGYTVCCASNLGHHPADVERVVILLDPVSLKPCHVFFGAHGNGQGTWLPYDECDKGPGGAIRVYVSPMSHGLYPKSKTYARALCCANDSTINVNHIWRPMKTDFQKSWAQSWSNRYYQVAKGINNPKNVPDPECRSITTMERIFLALPQIRNRVSSIPKIKATPLNW